MSGRIFYGSVVEATGCRPANDLHVYAPPVHGFGTIHSVKVRYLSEGCPPSAGGCSKATTRTPPGLARIDSMICL